MKKVLPLPYSICEEFSDTLLHDSNRNSILINVKLDYFSIIYKELQKHNYVLVFKKYLSNGSNITCVFKKEDK